MSGLAAIKRAGAAGISLSLRRDGSVEAQPVPDADLLADLRANKVGIATMLASTQGSRELPVCPRCRGQWFWRQAANGIIGDWTCVGAPIPPRVRQVDILGPVRRKARTVPGVWTDEASDPDTFARLLTEYGDTIVVAMQVPSNPRSRSVEVRRCR